MGDNTHTLSLSLSLSLFLSLSLPLSLWSGMEVLDWASSSVHVTE